VIATASPMRRGAGLRPAPLARGPLFGMLHRCALCLGLSALALVVFLVPGAPDLLAYDRGALLSGEAWRLLSGHLVHWSSEHLIWDVAAFAVLGALCESRSRRRFVLCLTGAATLIPAFLWIAQPAMERYAGLSGIDSALFALLGAQLLADEARRGGALAFGMGVAFALAFAFKIGFELALGQPLFAGNLGPGVSPTPLAHCAGAGVGLLCALPRRFA